MAFKKTNIKEKLIGVRSKTKSPEHILREVYEIIGAVTENQNRIQNNITVGGSKTINLFDPDLLEVDRIFHLDHIRDICIDYRLRFLDSKYFKGEIPQEALSEINRLEKIHGTEIIGFKIIAPSKLFKLKDKDDPLLFAPIGNNYFYLVHKWGNDLHPFRKLMMWPFKNIVNLVLLVLLISYGLSEMLPNGLFSKTNSRGEFWLIFLFMFKMVAAIVIYYGFALGKNFSPAIWKSKYFNA